MIECVTPASLQALCGQQMLLSIVDGRVAPIERMRYGQNNFKIEDASGYSKATLWRDAAAWLLIGDAYRSLQKRNYKIQSSAQK
jgi:hypothetical protein